MEKQAELDNRQTNGAKRCRQRNGEERTDRLAAADKFAEITPQLKRLRKQLLVAKN